ncbi:class III extradiol ring-cleavage dioxygenase [Raineyella sp. LH-20]|uniref:DODA-type extradiol aromatic ring-opening family dioxygenase n=1 Tax=Raineyella sp. LH-20 TaxID=3081204 RepID=UPI0029536749|nr:class III extradiol ring-cleavage dioxygenase [Raineyella sp. LH-20]WOP17234.1 class III extradiol ring-cleavage dioxygenase [Raineyella sp. LH-20]
MPDRMPAIFLSHGAPPLADDPVWPGQLRAWAGTMPRPASILMISAHWEEAPVSVSSTVGAPLVYDFWGFPEKYYQVTYDAPTAPELAATVRGLLGSTTEVQVDQSRGLDHGAYVPLAEMYPQADVPVLQLSLPTLDPRALFALGQQLAPLRDQGVLIVGSGFTTHNLRAMTQYVDSPPLPQLAEFDAWAADVVTRGDVDAILDFATKAPEARIAHPRTEHWAPIHAVLGTVVGTGDEKGATAIDGSWIGLSKRSWTFG